MGLEFTPVGGGSGGGLSSAAARVIALDAQAQHPGVGGYATPQYVNPVTAAVLSSGTTGLCPIILPDACTWDAIAVNITTAAVGGTYSLTLGLLEDPTQGNGTPATTSAILGSGAVTDLSATGVKIVPFDTATAVLPAGNYILASLYIASAAPSPVPQWTTISSSFLNQSTSSTLGGWTGTRARGRRRNGSTSFAEAIAAFSWTAATGSEVPGMAIRRAS